MNIKEVVLEAVDLPRFVDTRDKCIAMEDGLRCKNKAEIEMVYYGEGKVSQIIACLCPAHAERHDEVSYLELINES